MTIEVDGTCTRIDLVGYDKDGVLTLFEVKNGPKASFTKNQNIVWPKIENNSSFFSTPSNSNSKSFIPIGKNAARFQDLKPFVISRTPYNKSYKAKKIWY